MANEAVVLQIENDLQRELDALRAEKQELQQIVRQQQQTIATLHEEATQYRTVIDASNDAIFLIDPSHDQILDANPVACRMLGYTKTELLAVGISAIHPAEMPQLLHFAQQVFAQGQGWTDELTCRTKSGLFLPAEISASLLEFKGRSCLLALVRDTRARKQSEARMKREAARADALARVAARLNAQLDLASVLTAICEETCQALAIPASVLLFFDEKRQLFYPVATFGLPESFMYEYIPNPRSVYDQYPQQGAQIVVPNLRELPNLVNAKLFETYHIHAIAIASLNREDHLLGALSAYALDPAYTFSEDEIHLLRSLADLGAQAVRNAILYQTEQRRSEQFRAISEVGRHITAILELDELLRQITYAIRDAFHRHVHVGLGLIEGDELVIKSGGDYIGEETHNSSPQRFRIGQDGLVGVVAQSGQPMLIADVRQEPRYIPGNERIRSELVVPIQVKDVTIGVLNIESEELDAFQPSDLTIVQSLADQAAVAIENARLYEQMRHLAVLEERQRLARELHDSVTQALYGMTLFTAATSDLLTNGDVATAKNHLHVLQETAQLALREMRLLIFQLRSPSLEEGLAAALQERLESVEQRSGVRTKFQRTGVGCIDSRIDEDLYRIAQEALNNALKHARAQNVSVHLRQDNALVILEISDDGIGFDPSRNTAGMGLRGMRERVAQLGGALVIDSTPEQGTTIRVEVRLA